MEQLPDVQSLQTGLIASYCLVCTAHCIFQDRKVIVKSMKTYVVKICKEDHGHLVLLALFDSVDDTKLVQKAIIEVRGGFLVVLNLT